MSKVQSKKPYFRTLTQGNLRYVLNGKTKTASVLGLIANCDEVTIPTLINYGTVKYTVTSILESAFQTPCVIKSVKFEEDSKLLIIGKRAFYRSQLMHIDIPDSIQEICDKAFYKCYCLQKCINKLNTSHLKKIGKKAFYGSSLGDRLYLPSCFEEIGDEAFANCNNLTDIDIYSTSLKTIGKNAFIGTYISYIRLPSGIEIIKENAFKSLSLRHIDLLNAKIIGKGAFSNTNIDQILIPSNVEKIDDFAFKDSSLSKIEFAHNSILKTIGESAFSNSKINFIKIPSSCVIIGKEAFANCKNLNTIAFEDDSKLEIIDEFAFLESGLLSFTIPPNLKEVRKGWLNKCEKLEKICCNTKNDLFQNDEQKKFLFKKSSIEKVEYDTFVFCVKKDIQKIKIPDSIEIIDSYAFESCKSLQSVEISSYSNLRAIGEGAFAFTNIESLTLPPMLEELNTGWCYGMNLLNKIDVSPQNPLFKSLDDGKIIYKKSSIEKVDFDIFVFSSRKNQDVTIPSSIEIIEAYSFDNCRNLRNIDFQSESKLRLINDFAFNNTSIKSISIPSTVTKIGNSAFSESDLQVIEIQANSNLHEIENKAFANSHIRRFNSPRCLKKIGKQCFLMCQFLNNFVIPVDSEIEEIGEGSFKQTSIESFRIPAHLRSIENSTFSESSLKYVEFPENSELTTIETLAFENNSIGKLSIPSNVSLIKKFAFFGCYDLSHVEIPKNSNLTSIKAKTFQRTGIASFHIPPQIKHLGNDVFKGCNKLVIVELDEDTKMMSFDVELFLRCTSPIIMIPYNRRNLINRRKITDTKK